jgi:tetratricopeptide (TPR) repeat protein
VRLAPSIAAAAFAVSLAISSAPASAGEAEQKQALELYAKGKEAYKEGRFEDAVKLIDAAYALHPEPVLLYNLARAHEGLGDFPKAIAAYEKYLTTEKQIADRGAIEQKVTSLKRTVEEQARLARERDEALKAKAGAERPQDPKEPPRDPAKEGDSRGPSPWPWTIAALGAGGLVAGGVLGGLALLQERRGRGGPDPARRRDAARGGRRPRAGLDHFVHRRRRRARGRRRVGYRGRRARVASERRRRLAARARRPGRRERDRQLLSVTF